MGDEEDEPEMTVPDRGTASRGSPIVGSAPDDPDENRIIIRDPSGPVRVYELNENVKEAMEGPVRASLDDLADWYEIWWEGTTMVIEYEGNVRKPEARKTGGNPQHGQHQGLPRYPELPWMPRQGVPQAIIDINQLFQQQNQEPPEAKGFDKGLLPVHDFARIDIQERADDNPLEFEDILIHINEEPLDEANGQPQDVELDMDDVRDMTDGKETLKDGKRGTRYNL